MFALWLSLVGCEQMLSSVRVIPPGPDDTASAVDSDTVVLDTADTADTAKRVSYSLKSVTSGVIPAAVEIGAGGFVSPSNDHTYFLESDGSAYHYLTPSYTAPEGTFCVNGSEIDGDCRGTTWISGQVILKDIGGVCLDAVNGRLFLVKNGNGRIEVVDLLAGGNNAYSYNRSADILIIPDDVGNPLNFNSACAYDVRDNALLVHAPGESLLARFQLDSTDPSNQVITEASVVGTLDTRPTQFIALDDGTYLVDDSNSGRLVHIDGAAMVLAEVALDAPSVDLAVFEQTAYVALGSAGAVRVALGSSESLARPVSLSGYVSAVAVDPSTGLALFAHTDDGKTSLSLVDGEVAVDQVDLTANILDIATPSGNGDFVVATNSDGEMGFQVFDAWPDTPPDLPPLDVFLFTAIEEPFDSAYFEMDCDEDRGSTPSMATRVARIESNAAVLAAQGIPVALAMTHNFVTKLAECGDTALIDTLEGYGFELGVMVHNRPDYSCTDVSLDDTDYEGQRADYCEESSSDYCNPRTSENCVFDGTPDDFYPSESAYCPPGQWDCYLSFMDRYNTATEQHLYGGDGGRFIIGADRHGLWDFDWVNVYKSLSRPDGSEGFSTTFFAQGRAYSGELVVGDPREKNPVPWRPKDRTEVWAVGDDYTTWDLDSAFSDTVFFNGMPISTIKIYEWQLSGMHMGDYLLNKSDVGNGFQTYSEEDFEVSYQFLRNAINNRSLYANNAWYFHIHDLSLTLNLAEEDGTPFDSATWLTELVARIQQDYGDESTHPDAYIRWSTPSQIEARFLDEHR